MVSDSPQRLTVSVTDDLDGVRADRALSVLSGLTRSAIRQIIDDGLATVDDVPVGRREPLPAGAVVELVVPSATPDMAPEPIEFGVLLEDDDLAVIDKPAGLVVHPGAGNASGTLVHGMLDRWPRVRGIGQPGRWGIVHRLDRETSGAIVVALSDDGYLGLKRLVDQRAITRRYLALVHGTPSLPTGTIDAPIGRDARHPTRMRIQVDGRRSVTHYQLAEALNEWSLLALTLETGRTHQIRVHLNSIGLPVVGDRVYGRVARPGVDPSRVWLHAAGLEFEHPRTGDITSVEAPLPPDLAASLDTARRDV